MRTRVGFYLVLLAVLAMSGQALVSAQEPIPIRIMWTAGCDPRVSPNQCNLGSITSLTAFYEMVDALGATVDYVVPMNEATLSGYDVIIIDTCSSVSAAEPVLSLLRDYIAAGGSALVLGSNDCIPLGREAAALANEITSDRGIRYTRDDIRWYGQTVFATPVPIGHPVLESVRHVNFHSHAALMLDESAQPLLALKDYTVAAVADDPEAGSLIAVATTIEFPLDRGLTSQGDDKFIFWDNALRWLVENSREKLDRSELTDTDPLICVLYSHGGVDIHTGPSTSAEVSLSNFVEEGVLVTGQVKDAEGFTWWQVFAAPQWLREDVVDVYGACEDVPVIE